MINTELEATIISKIKEVYDPEIPVDVYELGLIYEVLTPKKDSVYVPMTLTAPSCPVAEALPQQVKRKIEEINTIKNVEVALTWTPSWDRSMISEEAELALGIL
jgi:FeS assembly SUF system protein